MTPMLRRLLVAGLIVLPFTGASAQGANMDSVKITTQKLGDGIFALFGQGGNIGVAVGDDATFVIDDQFAPLSPKITAAIAELTGKPVKFLINTHWHFDHAGGNENFANAGAILVSHDNVRKRLSTGAFIAAVKQNVPPAPKGALPIVTFSDSTTFYLNGETITAYHVKSAHTDGDVMVHFKKANVVHTGDVFVRGGFPLVDVSSGGSALGFIAAIEQLLATTDANTKFIPGHGPISTRADVEEYLAMMKDVRDKVAAAVKAKKAPETFAASKPLAAYEAKFGNRGFITADLYLEWMFRDLTAKK